MIEVKISISAPELSEAITRLAEALTLRAEDVHDACGIEPGADASCTPEPKSAIEKPPVVPDAPVAQNTQTASVAPNPIPANTSQPGNTYTVEQLGRAGAALMAEGKMGDLIALLAKYGVKALTELKPENYPEFAEGLVQLGAKIPEAA